MTGPLVKSLVNYIMSLDLISKNLSKVSSNMSLVAHQLLSYNRSIGLSNIVSSLLNLYVSLATAIILLLFFIIIQFRSTSPVSGPYLEPFPRNKTCRGEGGLGISNWEHFEEIQS